MQTLNLIGLALLLGAVGLALRQLAGMEKTMATKQDLEAAVETLADKVSTEIGEVTAELSRLNALIADQDLQPTIDKLNALSAAVEGIVTPVSPA